MTFNLSRRAIAEFISLFPYKLPHLQKVFEDRLALLEQEELYYKSVFDDNKGKLWEISNCILWFKETLEALQDDEVITIVENRRNLEEINDNNL